jgi:hypothetical protein
MNSTSPKIPPWNKPPKPVTIEALREFIASFGSDVAVLVTWTWNQGYHFVTVGADRAYADGAVRLRDLLAKGIQLRLGPNDRDRRGDHPPERPLSEVEQKAIHMLLAKVRQILPDVPVHEKLKHLYLADLAKKPGK